MNLNQELVAYMKLRAKEAGMYLDTYDADFHLGVIQAFLAEKNAALTSKGVKKFRKTH